MLVDDFLDDIESAPSTGAAVTQNTMMSMYVGCAVFRFEKRATWALASDDSDVVWCVALAPVTRRRSGTLVIAYWHHNHTAIWRPNHRARPRMEARAAEHKKAFGDEVDRGDSNRAL